MTVNVLAFGIVKEIFSGSSVRISLPEGARAAELKAALEQAYPRLQQLASCLLAVNSEYAAPDKQIYERDEIALIPPVSGG
ncbi:MAG: MoaD/ThiS family protein [Williamsia sp.]|nr:MoaD/ThiS family protein [Williamsia sp.]